MSPWVPTLPTKDAKLHYMPGFLSRMSSLPGVFLPRLLSPCLCLSYLGKEFGGTCPGRIVSGIAYETSLKPALTRRES